MNKLKSLSLGDEMASFSVWKNVNVSDEIWLHILQKYYCPVIAHVVFFIMFKPFLEVIGTENICTGIFAYIKEQA